MDEQKDTFTVEGGAKTSPTTSFRYIPLAALKRLTARSDEGKPKYGDPDNWRKSIGSKEYAIQRLEHVIEHALARIGKIKGEIPEDGDDDAAAIMWGGMVVCTVLDKPQKPEQG